jgi:protein ImuB
MGSATRSLSRALAVVTPRLEVAAPGCFWLEPFVDRKAPSQAQGEAEFAQSVRQVAASEGFASNSVGVAHGAITAHALARYGSESFARIPTGREADFLATLPCAALPLSPRTLGLLQGVGVTHIADLQRINAASLIARFGHEGERLYALSRGRDPRGPRSHPVEEPTRIHLPLPAPCLSVEPLLFVLRSALERLVDAQVERGRAVARVRLILHRDHGEDLQCEIAPSRPTTRPRLLLELLRLALAERLNPQGSPGSDESAPAIDALTLQVLDRAKAIPRQRDLFVERATDPALLERVLLRLSNRLGLHALRHPERVDTRHPDRQGRWRSLDKASPPPPSNLPPPLSHARACYRRLDTALPVVCSRDDLLDLSALDEGQVQVRAWHGAERRAGSWWEGEYDRTYSWAELEDGRIYRLYEVRRTGQWFLEGWLD